MEKLQKLKFLVVDDMLTMRKLVAKELKGLGITEILEAKDGKEALDLIKAHLGQNSPIQFVVCDWNMPVMSGIELLKTLRATENLKNLPFVMVTAEADQKQQEEAKAAGVDFYINKPLEQGLFREALQTAFTRRQPKV